MFWHVLTIPSPQEDAFEESDGWKWQLCLLGCLVQCYCLGGLFWHVLTHFCVISLLKKGNWRLDLQVLLAAQFGLQPLLAKRLLPKGAFASVILLSSNAMKIFISATVLLCPGPLAVGSSDWDKLLHSTSIHQVSMRPEQETAFSSLKGKLGIKKEVPPCISMYLHQKSKPGLKSTCTYLNNLELASGSHHTSCKAWKQQRAAERAGSQLDLSMLGPAGEFTSRSAQLEKN